MRYETLLLPILPHWTDNAGRPLLGPCDHAPEFLRTAYHEIPLVLAGDPGILDAPARPELVSLTLCPCAPTSRRCRPSPSITAALRDL
jgi:hypothetical protein